MLLLIVYHKKEKIFGGALALEVTSSSHGEEARNMLKIQAFLTCLWKILFD